MSLALVSYKVDLRLGYKNSLLRIVKKLNIACINEQIPPVWVPLWTIWNQYETYRNCVIGKMGISCHFLGLSFPLALTSWPIFTDLTHKRKSNCREEPWEVLEWSVPRSSRWPLSASAMLATLYDSDVYRCRPRVSWNSLGESWFEERQILLTIVLKSFLC